LKLVEVGYFRSYEIIYTQEFGLLDSACQIHVRDSFERGRKEKAARGSLELGEGDTVPSGGKTSPRVARAVPIRGAIMAGHKTP
jgi:hypothetical protein